MSSMGICHRQGLDLYRVTESCKGYSRLFGAVTEVRVQQEGMYTRHCSRKLGLLQSSTEAAASRSALHKHSLGRLIEPKRVMIQVVDSTYRRSDRGGTKCGACGSGWICAAPTRQLSRSSVITLTNMIQVQSLIHTAFELNYVP
jgi:hypothetical protein